MGNAWKAYLIKEGIKLEQSAPYCKEGNTIAERAMGAVGPGARTMMIGSGVPKKGFPFSVKHMSRQPFTKL